MINLIKMDVYRLLKTKSYYVMIIVTALLSIFLIAMLNLGIQMQQSVNEEVIELESDELLEYTDTTNNGIVIGVQVDASEEWIYDDIYFTDYINENLQGGLLLILCVIFVPIYVNAEQKNGYIKNVAGQLKNKGTLVLSKLVAIALEVLTIFVVFTVVSAICGKIEFKDRFIFNDLATSFKILTLQYLLYFAMSSIVMAITLICRSSAVGITYGILSTMGVVGSILYAFTTIFNKYLNLKNFNIQDYTVGTCITQIGNTEISNIFANNVAIKSITVSVIFIVIPTIISMLCMQRRDVK